MSSNAAREIFNLIIKAFDSKGWRYKVEEDDMKLITSFRGDDLAMPIIFIVDKDRELVRAHSVLETKFSKERRVEGSVATSLINWRLINGCFDYDMSDGQVVFRMVESFRNCTLSEDIIHYLVNCIAQTVDDYNDLLQQMALGQADLTDLQRRLEK